MTFKYNINKILLCASTITLLGCETVRTHQVDRDQSAGGLTYSMPVSYVKLIFTREIETVESLDKITAKYISAKAENDSAKKQYTIIDQAYKDTLSLYNKARSYQAAAKTIEILELARDNAFLAKEEAKINSDKSEKKFQKLKDIFQQAGTGKIDPKKWKIKEPKDKLVAILLDPSADPDLKFSANFPHSILRNEHHNIIVNEKGLLQSADIQSADQTATILSSIASAVAASTVPVPSPGIPKFNGNVLALSNAPINSLPLSNGLNNEDIRRLIENGELLTLARVINSNIETLLIQLQKPNTQFGCGTSQTLNSTFWTDDERIAFKSINHEVIIDPTNSSSVDAFNRKICSFASNLRFVASYPKTPHQQIIKTAKNTPSCLNNQQSGKTAYCKGFVYRRLEPIQMAVDELKLSPAKTTVIRSRRQTAMVNIPNASPLDYIEDSSSMFTARTSDLGFANGILTDYHITRPSEINEMAAASFEVVKAPFNAVAQVLKINVGSAESQKAIADAAYNIEKLRYEQIEKERSLAKDGLQNDIDIELLNARRDQNLALAIMQGDTKLQEEIKNQITTAANIEAERFNAEVTAISRTTGLTDAEIDAAIKTLKKKKEFLMLQKEIQELESAPQE